MNSRKKPWKWTIMVISDARQSVVRFRLHKLILYSFISIFLLLGLASAYFYHYNQSLQQTNKSLTAQLDQQTQHVTILESKVGEMESKAKDVNTRLKKLDQLENKVQQYIATMNGNIKNPHVGSALGPSGGIDIPISMNSVTKKQFTLSNHGDVGLSNSTIDQQMPQLINRYQTAITEMEKVNQKLKRVPTIWPTTSRRITSPFGARSDPFLTTEAFHTGVDIGASWGSPVYAGADGKIILSGWDGGYGNSIVIRHSSIYKTRYGHMSRLMVKQGEVVRKGEVIGYSGSTGRSTGPHLHYEILKYGKPVDPIPYMNFFKNHPVTISNQ